MAVPAAPPDVETAPVESPQATAEPVLELLGRRVAPRWTAAAGESVDLEAFLALRRLAFEALIEVARLRQEVSERTETVASLQEDVRVWQDRARTLSAARSEEKSAAQRRERELVTVLHSALTETDSLRGEVEWRRRPWWRRGPRPRQGTATPAQLLGSALR